MDWNLVRLFTILESKILPWEKNSVYLGFYISITMKSYFESQITWNLYQDSESHTLFYFVTDPLGKVDL